ncbi:MAG: hypothetical protein U0930_18250 [Pirellulales bacterium]
MNGSKDSSVSPKKKAALTEDWTAVTVGLLALLVGLGTAFFSRPTDVNWDDAEVKVQAIRETESALTAEEEAALSAEDRKKLSKKRSEAMLKKVGISWEPAPKKYLAKVGKWESDPLDSMRKTNKEGKPEGPSRWELLVYTAATLGSHWPAGFSAKRAICQQILDRLSNAFHSGRGELSAGRAIGDQVLQLRVCHVGSVGWNDHL